MKPQPSYYGAVLFWYMSYCVYKHTSPSRKVYVGITCQAPERRWRNGEAYKENDYFYKAILKYGWENFKHEILFDGLNREEACAKEIEIIKELKANDRSFGYNIEAGGTSSRLSEETKEKIRNKHIGLKPNAETRAKMSIAQSKRTHSTETREKIGKAQRGEKHHMYGKHHSAETRAKMSASHKGENAYWYGKKKPQESVEKTAIAHRKPVVCVETGEVYASLTAAAKAKGMSRHTLISNALNGISKTAGGFHWRFYHD